jgi:CRISPR-associated protein Csb2
MAPARDAWRDVMVFALPMAADIAVADREPLLHAVRRALMALSRDSKGGLPRLFSGHEADGAPPRSGRHEHVFLAGADLDGDGRIERLIVAAPWACDRSARPHRDEPACFDRVVSSLAVVRAGRLGILPLKQGAARSADNMLTGPALTWESHTFYRPTRHAGRGKEPAVALLRDVIAECERRGLPRPEPELLELTAGPNGGIAARLRLRFAIAVAGPIMLGRDSHNGGGLFEAVGR